jgi:hypothetical protein
LFSLFTNALMFLLIAFLLLPVDNGMTKPRTGSCVECLQCKTPFYVPNYRLLTAKYCSRQCLALSARQHISACCAVCNHDFTHISSRSNKAKYCSRTCYYKAQRLKGSVTVICKHCSTPFQTSPSHHRIYCSRACINKSQKAIWSPVFTTVRKSLKRRGEISACDNCGYDKHPEILGVHHKDHNRKNNERSNLAILCPNCHSLEHRKHTPH